MTPFTPSLAAYRALAELLERVSPEFPVAPSWLIRQDEQRDSARPMHRLVVVAPDDAARFVGVVEWSLHQQFADDSFFSVSVAVDPSAQRRGLGTALLRQALEALPADREVRVEAEASEARPWGAHFLERHGFRRVMRSTPSQLDLATFDATTVEPVVRRVESAGVSLRPLGLEGAGDVALLRAMHALQFAVAVDVPGVQGTPEVPFEVWRRAFADNPDFLPEGHVIALDRGSLVGMTQLWGSQGAARIFYTGFTGVARSHRRLGLALALKTRSLAWAASTRTPTGEHRVVRTSNVDVNPMLAINLRLGFVPQHSRARFELTVSPRRYM